MKSISSILAAVIAISSCSHSDNFVKQDRSDLKITGYSSFPSTNIKLKNSKNGNANTYDVEVFRNNYSTKSTQKNVSTIEFLEHIKIWSLGAFILGGIGLGSDSESKTEFGVLSLAGLVGLIAVPLAQDKELGEIKSKFNQNKEENTSSDKGSVILNDSDFYDDEN